MRVIAGTARRLLLKTPTGLDTRPTTDKIKETLFNMLMPYLSGALFVDLFSGSGGIGIEALSRGARKAYFVENNQKAIACITDNIEHTHFTDKSVVLKQDVFSALRGSIKDTADIIFLDISFAYTSFTRFLNDTTIASTPSPFTVSNPSVTDTKRTFKNGNTFSI